MPIDNAAPSSVHGVEENRNGIAGVAFLYSVGETHFRVRLRPVTPLDDEDGLQTFEKGDAWTVYEWSEVTEPAEDAHTVEYFDVTHVPRVVRDAFEGRVVQVPDLPLQ